MSVIFANIVERVMRRYIFTLTNVLSSVGDKFCDEKNNQTDKACNRYQSGSFQCINGFPGINMETLKSNLDSKYIREGDTAPGEKASKDLDVYQDVTVSFFVLLAIYFPAVTGIMTGTNMSGDLKDPQKSIPSGTIAATITTSLIYITLTILFGASIVGEVLRDKNGKSIESNMIVASLAWPSPWVVIVGSFLSTFGAALQCLCSKFITVFNKNKF